MKRFKKILILIALAIILILSVRKKRFFKKFLLQPMPWTFRNQEFAKREVSVFFTNDQFGRLSLEKHNFFSKEPKFYEIDRGLTYGNHGFVLDKKGNFISDTIDFYLLKNIFLPDLFYKPKVKRALKIDASGFVLSGYCSSYYYHWLLEILPKLRLMNSADKRIDYICLPNELSKFQKQSLELIGIDEKKFLQPCSETLGFKKLFFADVSSLAFNGRKTFCYQPRPIDVFFARNLFLRRLKPNGQKKQNYIYVSRQKSGTRKFVNGNEVENLLEKYGFTTFFLEDMTFEQQIKLFADAKVVVSMHGGGLANLIFATQGAKVLEIFPEEAFKYKFPNNMEFHLYPLICNILNLDHFFIKARSAKYGAKKEQKQAFANSYLPLQSLEFVLENYLNLCKLKN